MHQHIRMDLCECFHRQILAQVEVIQQSDFSLPFTQSFLDFTLSTFSEVERGGWLLSGQASHQLWNQVRAKSTKNSQS